MQLRRHLPCPGEAFPVRGPQWLNILQASCSDRVGIGVPGAPLMGRDLCTTLKKREHGNRWKSMTQGALAPSGWWSGCFQVCPGCHVDKHAPTCYFQRDPLPFPVSSALGFRFLRWLSESGPQASRLSPLRRLISRDTSVGGEGKAVEDHWLLSVGPKSRCFLTRWLWWGP